MVESDIALLIDENMGRDDYAVVVHALDRLPSYKWIKIDGQNGLGGGMSYGGFNYVIEGFAHDPTTNEAQPDLLRTQCGKILYICDLADALIAAEIEITLLPTANVAQLITGRSLREVSLQRNQAGRTPEDIVAELRAYKHCGSCTHNDCYCIRR